jgi:hypothetical protein
LHRQVQTLELTSVLKPTEGLTAALEAAVASFESGGVADDVGALVLPVKSVGWVSCDGLEKGTAVLEGSGRWNARVGISIDLGKAEGDASCGEVARFSAVAKHESLPA